MSMCGFDSRHCDIGRWSSGSSRHPVTVEITGSNPVRLAMKIDHQYNLEECALAFSPVLSGMAQQLRSEPEKFWTGVELNRLADYCEAMASSLCQSILKR